MSTFKQIVLWSLELWWYEIIFVELRWWESRSNWAQGWRRSLRGSSREERWDPARERGSGSSRSFCPLAPLPPQRRSWKVRLKLDPVRWKANSQEEEEEVSSEGDESVEVVAVQCRTTSAAWVVAATVGLSQRRPAKAQESCWKTFLP